MKPFFPPVLETCENLQKEGKSVILWLLGAQVQPVSSPCLHPPKQSGTVGHTFIPRDGSNIQPRAPGVVGLPMAWL